MVATWITVAELWRDGRVICRYRLKHDERGYYWEGLDCASWRRKTREAVDRRAARSPSTSNGDRRRWSCTSATTTRAAWT